MANEFINQPVPETVALEVAPNFLTAEMAQVSEATPLASGVFTMLRGKKLLAGAALTVASLTAAELPATPAAASSASYAFKAAWRVGCHANGRSSGFKAKFEFLGLKGKRLEMVGDVQGISHHFVSLSFVPATNDWKSAVQFYDFNGPRPQTIPAGHPKVVSNLYKYDSALHVAGPISFKLPTC